MPARLVFNDRDIQRNASLATVANERYEEQAALDAAAAQAELERIQEEIAALEAAMLAACLARREYYRTTTLPLE